MRIKRSEDGLILSLNKDFYNKDALDLAVRDFSRVCRVSGLDKGGYHLVRFSGLEAGELKEIALEFANYALSIMKAK